MRCVLANLAIGLLVCATFGCSSDDGEPVADASGQAPSTTATSGAVGMAPMGDPGAGAAAAAPPPPTTGVAGDSSAAMPGADAATAGAASGPPGGMPGPPGTPVMPGAMQSTSGAPYGMPGPAGTPAMPGAAAPGMTTSYAPGASTSAAIPGGSSAIPGDSSAAASAAIPGAMAGDPALAATSSDPALAATSSDPALAATTTMPGVGGYAVPGGAVPGLAGTIGTTGAAGMPGVPGSAGGQPAAPTTYDGFANLAFQQGRERDAIRYLQAWAVTSDAGASEVLSGIQWVPALKRPAMAVRWGVGVQFSAPRNFTGDMKPIGSQQQFGARRPDAGGSGAPPAMAGASDGGLAMAGMPGASGFGGGGGGISNESISKFAGDFGTRFLEQFQSRVSGGKFGKALQRGNLGPAPTAGGYGAADASGGIAAMPGASSMPGAAAMAGAGMPGAGAMPGAAGASSGSAKSARITTGLMLLGVGSEKELKDKALEEQVDVLAIFRVKISLNRAGLINNDVELVIVDPVKNQEIYNSPKLNNIKVQKDREQNKEDVVDKEVDKIFEVVDKQLTMTELPAALTPEIVKTSRVERQLLAGPIDDPLAVLTEIRFYNRGKMLSDEDTLAALAKVAGQPAAKTLMEGSEEDRKKVVEKWLPQS